MEPSIEKQIIEECLTIGDLKSFRLLAPAGSGKTYAIKELLNGFYKEKGIEFLRLRKQIAVITFTNLASNEIIERVGSSPLYFVSTIHSFIWELIKYYPKYIKLVMRAFYERKIQEQNDKLQNPRTRNKSLYEYQLKQYKEKLEKISEIKKFVYSPTGDNDKYNSLNHSDVLMIGSEMLTNENFGKYGFSKILISRFPILFIDECQDTNKGLMNAFLNLSEVNKKNISLGIFGDSMQRIYMDGIEDVNAITVEKQYDKTKNFRSKNRIVQLINRIRDNADKINQEPFLTDEGFVRAFIVSDTTNRIEFENKVRSRMDEILQADIWGKGVNVKILILEHMMAAQRFQFESFYTGLKKSDSIIAQIHDNRSNELNFLFEKLILMYSLYNENKLLQLKRVVLSLNSFTTSDATQLEQLKNLQKGVETYCSSYNASGKCIDILRLAKKSFPNIHLPETFEFLLSLSDNDFDTFEIDPGIEDGNDKIAQIKITAWRDALLNSISEAERCYQYMHQNSLYATHQGAKGIGYENVLAVFDDKNANGNQFSYEKLFKVKNLSETDKEHIKNNEDNTLARSIRLFYVVCSRAINNLALVIYTENKDITKFTLINDYGFAESEIEVDE